MADYQRMCQETKPSSKSREGADAQENSSKDSKEGFRITDRHASVPLQWSTLEGGKQDKCSGPEYTEGPETSTSGDMQS